MTVSSDWPKKAKIIFSIVLFITDVGSMLAVGVGLYNNCHQGWAAVREGVTVL